MMLELNVSENPSVLDLAIAFKNQLDTKVKTAEADIIDAELHVANAQRIAQAARSRHQSLCQQLQVVEHQISVLQNSGGDFSAAD